MLGMGLINKQPQLEALRWQKQESFGNAHIASLSPHNWLAAYTTLAHKSLVERGMMSLHMRYHSKEGGYNTYVHIHKSSLYLIKQVSQVTFNQVFKKIYSYINEYNELMLFKCINGIILNNQNKMKKIFYFKRFFSFYFDNVKANPYKMTIIKIKGWVYYILMQCNFV